MTEAPLKCRHCSFTVARWRTLKDGRRASGWNRIFAHIEENHPDLAEALEDELHTSYLGEANDP